MAYPRVNSRPTIGVLAGWQFYRTATNLSYLRPVFNGINQAARTLGCNLFFGCGMGASASPDDPIRPAWSVPAADVDYVPISPVNTDGLIVFNPLHSAERSRYIQGLITAGHPVLFIGAGEDGPTVVADNAGGIFTAVEHLIQHGHQRIAFLAGSPDDMQGDTGERLRAYQSALEGFGLAVDPRMVDYGRHVFDGGYAATRQILQSGASFSAILASNDEMALGAMRALKEAGRRVPEDVAVIGFDNRLEGAAHEPSLSSIHVPMHSMGFQAVALLLDHIEGRKALDGTTRVSTRLIARESCGCSQAVFSPPPAALVDTAALREPLVQNLATILLGQGQGLAEDACLSLCQKLVDGFFLNLSPQGGSPRLFQSALQEIIRQSTSGEDSLYIWQEAIVLFEKAFPGQAGELLRDARQTINRQMQQQHNHQVASQRWTSSRLTLLTANLLNALDEEQVYQTLRQHLPELGIQMGMLMLFEAEAGDPLAWCTLRSIVDPAQPAVRFRAQDFPPPELFAKDDLLTLALIPLMAQSGQLGVAIFGTAFFDLYGTIVQQVGGALNTARLYRQAMEGRRLAEEANRLKSRFLSTVSHELRSPLSLILGTSEMMLIESAGDGARLPEPTRKDVERILAYAQHLGGLIGDVIDLATSDAGQLRLNNEHIDLSKTLSIIVESGRQLSADKGLDWEALMPESGPWVWGDQTRLRQITLNLINNAIKFTEQGSIQLRVETEGDEVVVSVRDTGLGIAPGEQQVIFDEFWQSERSVSRGYGGLGLGLAICKRLVEMQGGKIGVISSGKEGAGSTFYFRLPCSQAHPGEQLAPATPAVEHSLLVFSNDLPASQRLREQLAGRGFDVQVEHMQRLPALKAQLNGLKTDAIILDISASPASGWEALKMIKGSPAARQIPVLFYTARQQNGALLELDYLTKPVELSELTSALDRQWLQQPLAAKNSRRPRTILIVDDEPNTLELHARIAQSHSPENRILKAYNGREALEIMQREVVDLLLLDLQMPEMDGFTLLEKMRAFDSTRDIPVVVVTGKVLTEADMQQLNQGVTAVLGKGLFNLDETVAHISSALERKHRLSGEAQRLTRSAMAYLHEHFAEPVTRRHLAQHIGISEDYLTACFRQELGTTPVEYLQRYRINQAKRRLKESQETITRIAMEVGFSDSGYFSRIFRRETGVTPEAFRRS